MNIAHVRNRPSSANSSVSFAKRPTQDQYKKEETIEEFEPLFDYSRVQPLSIVSIDDDGSDSEHVLKLSPKRRKTKYDSVECLPEKSCEVAKVIECDEKEEDWLLPPPVIPKAAQKPEQEDSTIKELRLKKQELASFAQSAEDVLRAVEESAKRERNSSVTASESEAGKPQPSKVHGDRVKIVISIQDKDELKQYRIYMDEKFERLFKMYAEKVKREMQSLVFCFDGDKVSPTATPGGLGMEDDDIIEVHVKSS
ncbi:Rad60/SUMO-like domain [Macleaya cordata]|uniref:Rad60/SUMO-like domain n=1 Tax=Macleaya cordata TaxID=56857 RepID=A0A200QUY1_MACCD|nr:Rad60/SUMO-like domain [Macleaya cordata]